MAVLLSVLELKLKQPSKLIHCITLLFSWFAILCHAMLLHHWIDVKAGQNLIWSNLLSFQIWLTVILILIIGLFKPIQNLLLVILPLAVISILLVLKFPTEYIVATTAQPKQLNHILLSALTISVFSVAALQAVMMAWQERCIRKHNYLVWFLPALEVMEAVLFQILGAGFILLTLLLLSSILAFKGLLLTLYIKKALLSLFAWLTLAVLLLGHYYYGWRGNKAVRWSLTGITVLIFIYFFSNSELHSKPIIFNSSQSITSSLVPIENMQISTGRQ
jgi:ABC-type uncharacterized transport system permease subunit